MPYVDASASLREQAVKELKGGGYLSTLLLFTRR